jgi:hypothetical protein
MSVFSTHPLIQLKTVDRFGNFWLVLNCVGLVRGETALPWTPPTAIQVCPFGSNLQVKLRHGLEECLL